MKRFVFLLLLASLICTVGCATNKDLQRVHGDFDKQVSALKQEDAGIRNDIAKIEETQSSLQKSQTEMRADITELRESIQSLKGITEGLRKDLTTTKDAAIREKLDNLSLKISYIENFLDIGKSENHLEGDKAGKIAAKNAVKGKTEKESAYALAYETFKEGKYEKARGEFQNFLKQYPGSEYSDNAQFWIGESYYFEKKYEKAILEYEKLVKNYPKGSKVPYALLKQGLSFLNLGDKASARLILQQIIKEYPNTNQARIARAKLIEIK
ncbi:MAG: tol-pal system protein YbgF [Syntrophales bacterium]